MNLTVKEIYILSEAVAKPNSGHRKRGASTDLDRKNLMELGYITQPNSMGRVFATEKGHAVAKQLAHLSELIDV